MKFFRNLKHIFAVTLISLSIISSSVFIFGTEFTHSLDGFFTYRTGNGVWQDRIYRHTLAPSQDIVIVKIDEKTLNNLQSQSDQKMLTIPKSMYTILVEKLEAA